jgi:hypothetical protein
MGPGPLRWSLYPDKYLVRAFADDNRNGRWDLGSLLPFRFAEPGWAVRDTVRIRARFEHTDYRFEFE